MTERFSPRPHGRCWAVWDRQAGDVARSNGAPWLCQTREDAAAVADRANRHRAPSLYPAAAS